MRDLARWFDKVVKSGIVKQAEKIPRHALSPAEKSALYDSLAGKLLDAGAEADRVFGAFGHANETAALLALMLPGVIAMISSTRGFWRLLWLGCSAATAAVCTPAQIKAMTLEMFEAEKDFLPGYR